MNNYDYFTREDLIKYIEMLKVSQLEISRKFDEVYKLTGVGVYEDLLEWIRIK